MGRLQFLLEQASSLKKIIKSNMLYNKQLNTQWSVEEPKNFDFPDQWIYKYFTGSRLNQSDNQVSTSFIY